MLIKRESVLLSEIDPIGVTKQLRYSHSVELEETRSNGIGPNPFEYLSIRVRSKESLVPFLSVSMIGKRRGNV